MAQMRLFEKEPEEMTLDEANKAFDHVVRNLSFEQLHAIEQNPEPRDGDSAHTIVCKSLARRIRALE